MSSNLFSAVENEERFAHEMKTVLKQHHERQQVASALSITNKTGNTRFTSRTGRGMTFHFGSTKMALAEVSSALSKLGYKPTGYHTASSKEYRKDLGLVQGVPSQHVIRHDEKD